MNFTPSRSKVSPPPPTLPESHHCAMPLSPAPPWPPATSGAPGPAPRAPPAPTHLLRRPRGRLHSTGPGPATTLLQHIPTFYLKTKLPTDSPTPFLWRTLPYTLLQIMNTVYCVCFKDVLFNCSLLPVLVTCLPHACFQWRVLGGNDEHTDFFLTLAVLFSK